MPSIETLMTVLLALVLLELTPGPDMMLTLARGIGQGRRIALLSVVGMSLVAGVVQVSLLVLGLASVLHRYPMALQILQWAGALYLLYLGAKMLYASVSGAASVLSSTPPISGAQAIKEGTINSLTNPKSLLFMFAFLPQFVDPSVGPVWLQLLVLGCMQKTTGIIALGSVALASGKAGECLARHPRYLLWQQRFTGMVMLGLGVRLFFSGNASK
ncbi:LysE family translocator [Vitreoscilla massiliensis]|uniref:LysE family translocator n=1 Tax=Vitreoscilla massiliensis TaxID=1689272 RepID=A0ABY4E3L2_9NEIS|nr:LysE family translocator [Vitreoscilla massiliensis]UOO89961.1 LysE family translocator [Vitreoscilla massiliensis]